ncbi:MAG: cytochrome c-type biogenesis protein, partial [Gammaproteobacteria bacterium]
ITGELRCLVCQNQSLADSHAELAGDLRREIFAMMQAGRTDREIIDFMVKRYGEFVLYRPPITLKTLALWFGPAVILCVGTLFLQRAVRHRRSQPVTLAPAERERVAKLLGTKDSAASAPCDPFK